MGNEGSKIKGLVIDKNAVEANDFWALYNAECPTSSNEDCRHLSTFQGEPIVKGQLWVSQGPMERAIKNLRIYRHPYILKYVTTWEEGGQKYLATERVRPLNDVLAAENDIQVCLGLRTILCSLIFLVEKALARHLNICTQSIYVTDNGSWRLAGFEYVWKAKEVNKQLIELSHSFRYQAAIDKNDRDQLDAIEQYAFATLCEQILDKCSKDESSTPHVQEFRNYCSTHLKHKNSQLRPKLSAVLLHPYFNHEFVLIHSFLFELPLKSVQERQQFFTSLVDRLRYFNEHVVASQLANSLLSRMVLLDATAQLCVTPYVLRTKTEHSAALFSHQTYIDHLLPKILKMFRLRDAQIRLILLEYFMEFVRLLSEEQLKTDILPLLLDGMQDTNDVLVAKTLRCMADLVPILGAATVLSGPRNRIFADGRPQAAVSDTSAHWVEPRSITPVMNGSDGIDDYMVSGSPVPTDRLDLNGSFNSLPQIEAHLESLSLPLRLSPDGGEDNKSAITLDHTPSATESSTDSNNLNAIVTSSIEEPLNASVHTLVASAVNATEDEDAWSDWETTDELQRLSVPSNEGAHVTQLDTSNVNEQLLVNLETNSASSQTTQATQNSTSDSYRTAYSSSSVKSDKKNIVDDISALDIQVQVTKQTASLTAEFDFFKDMEPVIDNKPMAQQHEVSNIIMPNEDEIQIDASRFAATQTLNGIEDVQGGWEMDEVDDDDDTVVWGNT